MIIYTNTEDRLVPAQLNMITLQVDKGGYIYIDRTTYEQAAILMDKYYDDWDGLCKMVGSSNHQTEIDFLKDTLPEPLNFLSPFISLIDAKKTFDGTLDQLVGCLHVISKNINFDKILRIPIETRRTVSFSGHITAEYALQWEEFKNECIPYDTVLKAFTSKGRFSGRDEDDYEDEEDEPKSKKKSKSKEREPIKVEVANKDDPVMAEFDQDEMAALVEEVDLDDIDWEAEMKKLKAEDEQRAKEQAANSLTARANAATSGTTTAASPAVAEAESGKALVDEWGDL